MPHSHALNHCRALVVADGAEIRRKIKKDYEKARRDLENSRRQFDQYHATDQPQFTRWLNSHFGALLTELRELGQKIAADEELILQVQSEVLFGRVSHARAYQRVMELRNHPEPPPTAADGGDADAASGERPETEYADEEEEEEDPLDEFFDAMFGGPEPGERWHGKRGPQAGPGRGPAAPAHASSRLKNLYRRLVRQLHPDSQREMTAQKTEWWHQAQAAYEAGDADQLEVILSLCEIGDTGTTAHTSASLLQRITAQLKSSLRQIKRQLTELRREPAWNFSRRADREILAIQVRRGLAGELLRMHDQWVETQALIAEWKAAVEHVKQPRPRRRKSQPQNMEFPF